MSRENGFDNDPERARAAGKKSKKKGLDARMQEYLETAYKDGDARTREDILRDALFKYALKGNMAAVKELLDRAHGKPKMYIATEIDASDELIELIKGAYDRRKSD